MWYDALFTHEQLTDPLLCPRHNLSSWLHLLYLGGGNVADKRASQADDLIKKIWEK